MKIIDRSHPDFSKRDGRASKVSISFGKKDIKLSVAAARDLEIKPYSKIHFMEIDDRLYFYCDGEDTGITIYPDEKGQKGLSLRFSSNAILNILSETYARIRDGARFGLKKTGTSYNGYALIEILIHQTKIK